MNEQNYRDSLHAALAELDALRANYAAMHEAHALTARQKRNAEDRLAAVEKLCDEEPADESQWRLVEAIRAALGAAVTPAPQETCGHVRHATRENAGGLRVGWRDNSDGELWEPCPATPTPEAATDEHVCHGFCDHPMHRASGLQRATEQQQEKGSAQIDADYASGRWCGECRWGVVEDPPCCFTADAVGVLTHQPTNRSRSGDEHLHRRTR